MPSTIRNTRAFAALIFVAVISIAGAGQIAQAGDPADETAIRENVQKILDGWNTRSGALLASPFAENADYVVINGMHVQGRTAIADGHQQIFDTIYKDSKLALEVSKIRFLRPDVALVHVTGHLDVTHNGATNGHDATMTLVMTKEAGTWQIAAFQNTKVSGPPSR